MLSWFQSLSFYCQEFSDEFKVCAIGMAYDDMIFILTTQILCFAPFFLNRKGKGKGKAVPLQTWTGPEGSWRLSLPDFMTLGT